MSELGKLVQVDLRKVWEHEARDFSAWLVKPENLSLTITAQAERAFSFWPNKGEADTRPVQEIEYQRLDPIAPHDPVVPVGAYGSLAQ
jgi:hypothetical protein